VKSPSRIPNRNSLFRHCIFPVSFKGGAFANDKFWRLFDEPDGSVLGSLAWERYAPTLQHVHEHGCRMAFGRNQKKRDEGTFKEKSRQVYCGAYEIKAKVIRKLPADKLAHVQSADVVHHIEEGEIAHTDLKIIPVQGPVAFDPEATKTIVVDRLWRACTGPIEYICSEDQDLLTHPNTNLPTPPSGEYVDRRWWITRLWYLWRFERLMKRYLRETAKVAASILL
jgi:hypothetical protein